MALFLGSKSGDVLSWRGTGELLESIRGSFAQRAAFLLDGEEKGLLRALRRSLSDEIAYEEQFSDAFSQALEKLEKTEFEDQLAPLIADFYKLVSDYFLRRGSVVALQGVCTTYFDALMRTSIRLAEDGLLSDGLRNPPEPYCWLVSASAGREEQAFNDIQQHVLVYDGSTKDSAGYYEKLSYRIAVTLKKAGILGGSERQFLMRSFWCGSKAAWLERLNAEFPQSLHDRHVPLPVLPGLSTTFKAFSRDDEESSEAFMRTADLRPIAGDGALCADLEEVKRAVLLRFRESEAFSHLARQSAVSPIALGMFGWFRVERSGKHRGEFDIEQSALNPLIANIRLLAVKYGVSETGTVDRVRELLNRGHLNVDIADKVVRAYHEIARQKILLQIQSDGHNEGELFVNPENLSESDGERLRSALEVVSTLQRIVHSDFLEHA